MPVTTKKMERPKLEWQHRIYFPEIFRGVIITGWHFWRNLSLHILHAFGLFKEVPAMVTVSYPEQKRDLPARSRTRHRLTRRADGSPRCVACMMCETVCPALCIEIVAGEHPDPTIEKRPESFRIDLGKCVYCGLCVEVCPEDAIRMDTQILHIAAYHRQAMVLEMDELLNPDPAYAGKIATAASSGS